MVDWVHWKRPEPRGSREAQQETVEEIPDDNLSLKAASQPEKDARSMKNGIAVKLLTSPATVRRQWRILVMTAWISSARGLSTLRFSFFTVVPHSESLSLDPFLSYPLTHVQDSCSASVVQISHKAKWKYQWRSEVFQNYFRNMQLHLFQWSNQSKFWLFSDPHFSWSVITWLCVCSCVHLSALEVAALALLRSTESARRSHGRLSGADS